MSGGLAARGLARAYERGRRATEGTLRDALRCLTNRQGQIANSQGQVLPMTVLGFWQRSGNSTARLSKEDWQRKREEIEQEIEQRANRDGGHHKPSTPYPDE